MSIYNSTNSVQAKHTGVVYHLHADLTGDEWQRTIHGHEHNMDPDNPHRHGGNGYSVLPEEVLMPDVPEVGEVEDVLGEANPHLPAGYESGGPGPVSGLRS